MHRRWSSGNNSQTRASVLDDAARRQSIEDLMTAIKNLPVTFAPVSQHNLLVQSIELPGALLAKDTEASPFSTARESRTGRSLKRVKFQPRRLVKAAPLYIPP